MATSQQPWEKFTELSIATLGPLVAAGTGSALDIPGWAPALLAGAAAAGITIRDIRTRKPWSEIVFRACVGAAAGAWTTWSTITGPWHLTNLAAGAAAALFGAFISPGFVGDDAPTPADGPRLITTRAGIWKSRIERLARVNRIEVIGEYDWPNRAGFNLHIAFAPESGDGWDDIEAVKRKLARAARLPAGAVISVEEGDIQGTAVVRIPTVYAFKDDVPLPADTSPLSIWDDLPIGVNEDTSPALVNLRQASGLFAGRRGGGKTNLLKVLIGQLLRCRDSLVWVADLNGGGLAVPFMLPFAEKFTAGHATTPPIDWVAATPAEIVLMAQVAAAVAKDRKARYAGLTARSGGDLLPVSPEIPQITIVVDESAEVDDDPIARKAMDELLRVQRIGRAEGVNVIFSALRATQDTVPVMVRKMASLKLCGPVEDDTELDYVLPGAKVKSSDLQHPGTMFMRRGDLGAAVRQVKIFRTLPGNIREIVAATADTRPVLDGPGRQVGADVYAQRMQRLMPWLAALAHDPDFQAPAGEPVPVAATPAPPAQTADVPLSKTDRDALRERARRNARRAATADDVFNMPENELEALFRGVVADLTPAMPEHGEPSAEPQTGEWKPDLLIDLAADAGPDGITPSEMSTRLETRGIRVSDKTLFKWLKTHVEQGRLVNNDGRYTAP